PVAAHSSGVIKADSIVSTIASVTLVALLFALFYRRALASALIGGVAAAGILVGLGVHALFVREVSPLAAVVGALLAGLGTDYGIHFLSHYDEHRARGMDASASAVETSRTMLLPIATNCFTSIFGFASLWPSPIRMLRDFSTMGAAGLVGALVAVFALMPALLRIVDRRVAVPLAAPARMAKLTDSVVARPGRWLGAALGVLCVLAAGAITRGSGLEFEPDLTVMHPRPSPPLDAAAAIADRFGEGGEFVPVEVRAASTSELLGTAHRLTDELLARSDVGVRAVLGLQVLIPAPGAEERVRRALATLDPESVRACFDRRVNESAFDLDSYGQYRRFLGDLVAAAHCPTVADLLRYPALAERIFPAGSGAEPTSTVLVIRLAEPLTDRAQRTRVITALAETTRQFPGVTLAGLPAVSEELEQATREGLPASVALSITLVVGWLWLVFRRARLVALALIPLLFAAGATVCFMMATGAKFNPINSVAIPLLDGIAVDAGVFLVSAARSHSASREELRVHLRATTHAVMLAVLTTVTAFAALCFSHTPAIRSLGMVSAVGAAASMFGALFVLMPLLVRSAPAVGRGTSGHP
ncbi:MAG: MMPL family transporter, partial [Phycisphaerales bacterium]